MSFRILVFGRTGQVAMELAARTSAELSIQTLPRASADLTDPLSCAKHIADADVDAVINAAAYTAVDKAEEEEALAHRINAEAPGAMADACARRGLPFVHISTDYVFRGEGEVPMRESDPTGPLSAYGRTKLDGEDNVLSAGGSAAILRTSWVFSAHGNNFVKTMLRLSETRDALRVVEDQHGSPTPASDIAAACITVARTLATGDGAPGIYHFAATPYTTWADFAREIFLRAGRKVAVEGIPTSGYPTPAARPTNSRLDCTKIAGVFGISAPNWYVGLDAVLADLEARDAA